MKIQYDNSGAGLTTIESNTFKRHFNELCKSNIRPYSKKHEDERDLFNSKVEIKDQHFYSKLDALWNEP